MVLQKRYASVGMVAFVDLLGYSARVAAISTAEDLEAIESDVRKVQEWLDYEPEDEVTRDVQRLQAKTVLAFSDCLVIAVPSRSELADADGDFDVQLGELVSLAYAQGRCAVNGIFVRGGADYGLWYKRKDVLISPPLVVAYNLEKCAIVPMIAISGKLLDHFQQHSHREFYDESEDPVREYFREFELPDGNRRWMLDYFPLFLGEIDGQLTSEERGKYDLEDLAGKERLRNHAWERAIRNLTSMHRNQILRAYLEAASDHIKIKYRWLARYHDETVRRLFQNPEDELLIGALPD